MADSKDDEIIELTQVVDGETSEDQEVIELTQMAEAADLPEPARDDAVEPGATIPDLSGISQNQLDAAIERVIERKFSQQIEKILFEVTQTVIKREIADIRAGLQKDLDDIDTA